MTTLAELSLHKDAVAAASGAARVAQMRKIYGTSFALDFGEEDVVAEIVPRLDDVSLGFLVRDLKDEVLAARTGSAGP